MSKEATKDAAPAEDPKELVAIFHTGAGYGPQQTVGGLLRPSESVKVPRHWAEKLTRTYPHIKLAEQMVGSSSAKAENKRLRAEIKKLEEQLAGAPESFKELEKQLEASRKAAQDALEAQKTAEEALAAATPAALAQAHEDLQQVVREFLAAGSKKELEALQEKHKDAVPAAEAATPAA